MTVFALMICGCTACGGASPGSTSTRISANTSQVRHNLGPSGHEDDDGDHDFHSIVGDYRRAAVEHDLSAALSVAAGHAEAEGLEVSKPVKPDGDGDHDVYQGIQGFGHRGSAGDQRAVGTLVRRYFAAAAAGDGAAACPLLAPSFAKTVVSVYGQISTLRGDTCAAITSKLFKLDRRNLTVSDKTLYLTTLLARGSRGVAILAFSRSSQGRQIAVRRERGKWRIDALLDGSQPVDGEAR